MLISSDDLLVWISDLSETKVREMQRAARRGDVNTSTLAVGGQDALDLLVSRIKGEVAKHDYESMRHAEKQAKKLRMFKRESA